MIAHRLSTIRRADNIIVIQDGLNIEDGTHEDLIHRRGMYYSMIHAQQLEPLTDLGKYETSHSSELLVKEEFSPQENYSHESDENQVPPVLQRENRFGFFHSLWVIAREHRSHWILYILIGVGAMGAGCKFDIHIGFIHRLTVGSHSRVCVAKLALCPFGSGISVHGTETC